MDHTIIFNSEVELGSQPTKSVYDAIVWCDQEVGFGNYSIDNQFPSWRWAFKFKQAEDATHFALRWL